VAPTTTVMPATPALTMITENFEPYDGEDENTCIVQKFEEDGDIFSWFKILPHAMQWHSESAVLAMQADKLDQKRPITLQMELDSSEPIGEDTLIRISARIQPLPVKFHIPPPEYCESDVCRFPEPDFNTDNPVCGTDDPLAEEKRVLTVEEVASKVMSVNLNKMLATHTSVQVWAIPTKATGSNWQTPQFQLKNYSFVNTVA